MSKPNSKFKTRGACICQRTHEKCQGIPILFVPTFLDPSQNLLVYKICKWNAFTVHRCLRTPTNNDDSTVTVWYT